MNIRKVQIDNFGKFYQKEFYFSPGLNLVYGENESGKSTLHSFLLGMLFGMEKPRGRARESAYGRYEPWNTASYYSGSLEFEVGNKQFTLERNFYHKEKTVRLYNQREQEELSVEHGDLDMLLGGVGKGFYENTYCISQAGVVTEEDFAKDLQQQLLNLSCGGDSQVDIRRALKQLGQKQRQEEQKLKAIGQQKKEQQDRLEWEQERLREDIRQLEQKQLELQQEQGEQEQQTEEESLGEPESKRKKSPWPTVILGVLLVLWHNIWKNVLHLPELPFMIVDLCLWIGWVLWIILQIYPGHFEPSPTGQTENPEPGIRELLKEQLDEKQLRLLNVEEEAAELEGLSPQERQAETERRGILLAIETMEQVAQESYQEGRDEIQAAVSGIFSGLTEGAYDRVEISGEGRMLLYNGDKRLEPWQLSRGTMEQLYFALRLGVGRCMIQEEPLPVLLDEPFCTYDDIRLKRTLQWLAKQPEQIILFSCQKRELAWMEELDILHNRIIL